MSHEEVLEPQIQQETKVNLSTLSLLSSSLSSRLNYLLHLSSETSVNRKPTDFERKRVQIVGANLQQMGGIISQDEAIQLLLQNSKNTLRASEVLVDRFEKYIERCDQYIQLLPLFYRYQELVEKQLEISIVRSVFKKRHNTFRTLLNRRIYNNKLNRLKEKTTTTEKIELGPHLRALRGLIAAINQFDNQTSDSHISLDSRINHINPPKKLTFEDIHNKMQEAATILLTRDCQTECKNQTYFEARIKAFIMKIHKWFNDGKIDNAEMETLLSLFQIEYNINKLLSDEESVAKLGRFLRVCIPRLVRATNTSEVDTQTLVIINTINKYELDSIQKLPELAKLGTALAALTEQYPLHEYTIQLQALLKLISEPV
jgi:hypothetical protein